MNQGVSPGARDAVDRHDGAVPRKDRHRPRKAGARPESTRTENPMSTLKLMRSYGRYLATSLAAVAFKITTN